MTYINLVSLSTYSTDRKCEKVVKAFGKQNCLVAVQNKCGSRHLISRRDLAVDGSCGDSFKIAVGYAIHQKVASMFDRIRVH